MTLPAATTNHTKPAIGELERNDIMAALRDVFAPGVRLDAEAAIRATARKFDYNRTGPRIYAHLKNELRVAVLRGLLRNEQGEYVGHCRRIADYTLDEQITHLLAAIPRGWTLRDDAIQAAARYLGFRRTGPAIEAAFRRAVTVALRRRLLESSGDWIRK